MIVLNCSEPDLNAMRPLLPNLFATQVLHFQAEPGDIKNPGQKEVNDSCSIAISLVS